MSHKATYWLATVPPSMITAGSFRVLFHLCDHHNDEKDADKACYPSQETLMKKTGLSNGGLNKCLNDLENTGLISRKKGTIPESKKRRTYYILGCDIPPEEQTPESGVTSNSTQVETDTPSNSTPPELDGENEVKTNSTPVEVDRLSNSNPVELEAGTNSTSGETNSTFCPNKLHSSGEEPVKEPVIGTLCVAEGSTHTAFDLFWEAHPRSSDPEKSEAAFNKAIEDGATADQIIAAARAYADEQQGNGVQYIATSWSWLEKRRWTEQANATPQPTEQERMQNKLQGVAINIKSGQKFVCTQISPFKAYSALAAGLVSLEECHAVGLLLDIKQQEAAE